MNTVKYVRYLLNTLLVYKTKVLELISLYLLTFNALYYLCKTIEHRRIINYKIVIWRGVQLRSNT